jgi:hypothetical protein
MDRKNSKSFQFVAYHPDLALQYFEVINRICEMAWSSLSERELVRVAWAYYYFSIQFRENLEIACQLHPNDVNLKRLHAEECNTANLSPWPGIATPDEKLNHDEFMARLLRLQPIDGIDDIKAAGNRYLASTRAVDDLARAKSIGSYEDGGLSDVFSAFLQAPGWEGPTLQAFRHFLQKHVEFDSDNDAGHGVLAQTLSPDDTIAPLWELFEDILHSAIPRIASTGLRTFQG